MDVLAVEPMVGLDTAHCCFLQVAVLHRDLAAEWESEVSDSGNIACCKPTLHDSSWIAGEQK